jgi:hypothetical protein
VPRQTDNLCALFYNHRSIFFSFGTNELAAESWNNIEQPVAE